MPGSAVGYVWQKSQIYQLGQQIRQREIRLAQLRDENQKLSDQLAMLRSPPMLDQRARELNLGLVPGAADAGLAAAGTAPRRRKTRISRASLPHGQAGATTQ